MIQIEVNQVINQNINVLHSTFISNIVPKITCLFLEIKHIRFKIYFSQNYHLLKKPELATIISLLYVKILIAHHCLLN